MNPSIQHDCPHCQTKFHCCGRNRWNPFLCQLIALSRTMILGWNGDKTKVCIYIIYIYNYIYICTYNIYIYTHPSIPSDSSVGHPCGDLPGGSLQKYRMGPYLLHRSTRCSRPPGFAWQILAVQVWRDFQRFVWKWGIAQLLAFSANIIITS